MPNKLDDLISALEPKFAVALIESREDGNPKHRKDVINKAKAQIKELMLELVGEDEMTTNEYGKPYPYHRKSDGWYRNKLRAELREKVKAL